jgi:hypothetical protein
MIRIIIIVIKNLCLVYLVMHFPECKVIVKDWFVLFCDYNCDQQFVLVYRLLT